MRVIQTEFFHALRSQSQRIVWAWKIVRRDGFTMGLSSSDTTFTYEGIVYEPANSFNASAASSKNNLSVDNMNAESVITNLMTEKDLRGGLWDNATIFIFWIVPNHPEWGIIPIRGGTFGEVELKQTTFEVEVRSWAQKLQNARGPKYTLECGTDFGDSRCGVPIPTFGGQVVTGIINRGEIVATGIPEANVASKYKYGLVTWTTGDNAGISVEIRAHKIDPPGFLAFLEPMPFAIKLGDVFTLQRGCAKTRGACIGYNNIANFRGFPDMPTEDRAMNTPNFTSQGQTVKKKEGS